MRRSSPFGFLLLTVVALWSALQEAAGEVAMPGTDSPRTSEKIAKARAFRMLTDADEQVRAAAGFEWQISESWSFGANYTFAWLGNNDIDQSRLGIGRVSGDYDATAHVFGLYGRVSF